jgi:hypothetical protein
MYNPNSKGRPFLPAEKHPRWKGGRILNFHGYMLIYKPEHPFCNNNKYIAEHRLVMEKHLKRFLKRTEIVHHINNIKTDNRIENLQLFNNWNEHRKFHPREHLSEQHKEKLRQAHKNQIPWNKGKKKEEFSKCLNSVI